MLDVEKFVDGLHEYLERAFQPLAKRVEAVEARLPEKGERGADGKDGRDGKDADPRILKSEMVPELLSFIDTEMARRVALIPIPKDGLQGKDGAAGEQGIKGDKGETGEVGLKGEKGEKGDAGRDGKDFDPELVVLEVARVLPSMVERAQTALADRMDAAFKALPPAMAGERGPQGEPGRGEKGADGRDGADGKSVTLADLQPVMESMEARIALGIERRAADIAEKAVARIPVPKDGQDGASGKDGTDGFGFDDFDVDFDGQRTFTFKWTQGERVKTKTFKPPLVLYRGVYKASEPYEKGDSTTYGGSLWIAQKDAPGTPGDGSSWKLAVKKGADAK